jgi:hypothetical protein
VWELPLDKWPKLIESSTGSQPIRDHRLESRVGEEVAPKRFEPSLVSVFSRCSREQKIHEILGAFEVVS